MGSSVSQETVSKEAVSEKEPDIYALYDERFTNPTFTIDSIPAVQAARDIIQATGNGDTLNSRSDIDYFLDDEEESQLPPSLGKFIRQLVRPGYISTSRYQSNYIPGGAGKSKAWIDDRMCQSDVKAHRCYQNPVSASVLQEALKRKRWEEDGQCDADRRLVHIEDLDGEYMSALVATALPHELAALNSAIASYLTFNTLFSLTVFLSRPVFRISLHMAFPVVLREETGPIAPPGLWSDSTSEGAPIGLKVGPFPPRLCTARKTIELCALGYKKYAVWSFADRLPGGDSITDAESSEFHYELHGMASVHADQIGCGRTIDANLPIEDARDYTLVQFNKHIAELLEHHWRDVFEAHAEPFRNHRQMSVPPGIPRRLKKHNQTLKQATEQTQWWRKRLNMLQTDLKQVIHALDEFLGPYGGIEFISRCSRLERLEVDSRLRSIRNSFVSLQSLERKLAGWSDTCARDCEMLDKRLTFEANNRNMDMANNRNMDKASLNRVTMLYGAGIGTISQRK